MLRTIYLILFFVVLIVGAIYFALTYRGTTIVARTIENATHRATTVRHAQVIFPTTLRVDGLVIEGLLEATEAKVTVDLVKLLSGDVKLSSVSLLYPKFYMERSKDGKILFGKKHIHSTNLEIERDLTGSLVREQTEYLDSTIEQVNLSKDKTPDDVVDLPDVPVIIAEVIVKDGQIEFVDFTPESPKTWIVDDVQLQAASVPLNDYDIDTHFSLVASLARLDMPFVGKALSASGWINWPKKNMDANINVNNANGKSAMTAHAQAKDNDLIVNGQANLGAGTLAQGKNRLEDALSEALSAAGAQLEVNFSFQTKLNRIQLSNISFGGQMRTDFDDENAENIVGTLKEVGKKIQTIAQDAMSESTEDKPVDDVNEAEQEEVAVPVTAQ